MVEEKDSNGEKVFICQECKFKYKEKQWAEKCEKWCKQYHSCNIEITKHAIDV